MINTVISASITNLSGNILVRKSLMSVRSTVSLKDFYTLYLIFLYPIVINISIIICKFAIDNLGPMAWMTYSKHINLNIT